MMHGPEKSDLGIVAMKPANKTEQSVAEPVERRAGDQGECGPAKHVPDSEPHKRVTGAGTHTERNALPSNTRGGSRMRESRTYGSVRGARAETRVPTATDAVCCGA